MAMNEAINKEAVSDFLGSEIKEISGRWASFEISKRALEKAVKEKEITVTAEVREKAEAVKKLLEGRNDAKRKELMEALPKEDKDAFDKVNEFENQKKTLENVIKNIEPTVDFLEVATQFKAEVDAEIGNKEDAQSDTKGADTGEKTAE